MIGPSPVRKTFHGGICSLFSNPLQNSIVCQVYTALPPLASPRAFSTSCCGRRQGSCWSPPLHGSASPRPSVTRLGQASEQKGRPAHKRGREEGSGCLHRMRRLCPGEEEAGLCKQDVRGPNIAAVMYWEVPAQVPIASVISRDAPVSSWKKHNLQATNKENKLISSLLLTRLTNFSICIHHLGKKPL